MPRHAPQIILTTEEAETLKATSKSRTAELRQVERAKIILACAADMQNEQIAKEMGIAIPTVAKWRKRFAKQGLPGLRDSERPGKPATYGSDFRNRLFDLIDQDPPLGMARWDCPSICKLAKSNRNLVWHIVKKDPAWCKLLQQRKSC